MRSFWGQQVNEWFSAPLTHAMWWKIMMLITWDSQVENEIDSIFNKADTDKLLFFFSEFKDISLG